MWKRNANKFNAVKVKADGFTFDSKAEYRRYCELKLLEQAGEIRDLKVHPRYKLEVNGIVVGTYEGDSSYEEKQRAERHGADAMIYYGPLVVEDVKGVKTRLYILKRNLFKAINPNIIFKEIPCRTN